MQSIQASDLERISGGYGKVGDTYTDLNGGTFSDLNKHYAGLYIAIGETGWRPAPNPSSAPPSCRPGTDAKAQQGEDHAHPHGT